MMSSSNICKQTVCIVTVTKVCVCVYFVRVCIRERDGGKVNQ